MSRLSYVPFILLIFLSLGLFAQNKNQSQDLTLDFVHNIHPGLFKNGCSTIGCHVSGPSNLQLSMFGAFSQDDYDVLVKQSGGRYVNFVEPGKSLLVRKLTGELPHSMSSHSVDPKLKKDLLKWIKNGAPYNNNPNLYLKELKVTGSEQILQIEDEVELKVEAVFSDGSILDVTNQCTFESCNTDIVTCGNRNQVVALNYGEAVIVARYMHNFGMTTITVPHKTGMKFPTNSNNRIDQLVNEKLKMLGIVPSKVCSNQEFMRRTYLNLTGRLPSSQEVRSFLKDQDKGKRAKMIDQLLESDEYTDFQVLKWGDLLRCKSEFPSNLWPNAVQAYSRWMKENINSNTPYDQFARELLVSTGSNFRNPQVNFYRAFQQRIPNKISESAGLIFMGTRFECARCHAHPKSNIVRTDTTELGNFFTQLKYKKTAEWKEEIVSVDPDIQSPVEKIKMPDGTWLAVEGNDHRQVFADWLTTKENPLFAKVIVNRIWFWLMGRGIVHEPDDFRETNPPVNPELLSYLEKELIDHDFDLKHIFRIILKSQTYQRSSKTNKWNEADKTFFSHYPLRRLEAEQLIDAVCDITGVPDSYMSKVPEPFTFLPPDQRAVQLTDGTITSGFLEMFGRPSRDSSYEGDRNNNLTMKQTLHFLNSSHIMEKIEQSPTLSEMIDNMKNNNQLINEVYLSVMSRYPSKDVQAKVVSYFSKGDKRENLNDLVWALINTKEFVYNH